MTELDEFDIRLLDALQADGRASNAVLAEAVRLSPSQVSRRLARLEAAGVVSGYRPVIERKAIGLGVMAFTSVSLERHAETASADFERAIRAIPEVLECHALTGEADYILRIVAADLEAFSQLLLHRLMRLPGVRAVHSNIVLESIKPAALLPLGHLRQANEQRGR
jgi:Lrp/AsnC family transcriptional regulator, leucine-responsive regulatory protein